MKKHSMVKVLAGLALCLFCAGIWTAAASAADIERISKEHLKELLGSPDLLILDVRPAKEWKASRLKIKGAVWEDFEEVDRWAPNYPKDAMIVLYCA